MSESDDYDDQDQSSDSDFQESSDDEILGSEPDGLYGNEPEYTEAEMELLEDATENSASNSDGEGSDLDSSRLENLHWCSCSECSIMPTLSESKCCQEFKGLLGEKLSNDMRCITQHAHFEDICLKTHILEASYLQHRRYKNNFSDIENMTNRYISCFVHFFYKNNLIITPSLKMPEC